MNSDRPLDGNGRDFYNKIANLLVENVKIVSRIADIRSLECFIPTCSWITEMFNLLFNSGKLLLGRVISAHIRQPSWVEVSHVINILTSYPLVIFFFQSEHKTDGRKSYVIKIFFLGFIPQKMRSKGVYPSISFILLFSSILIIHPSWSFPPTHRYYFAVYL